ncbi:MAG: hypothetical protein ACOYKA_00455 [Legionellaceae bacterium]
MKQSNLLSVILLSGFLSASLAHAASDPITGAAKAVGEGAVGVANEAGKITGEAVTGVEKGTKSIVDATKQGYEEGKNGNKNKQGN